ncbi:expressed unknown protein [Seminavis robusta]|uniref:Uncharacterized protein n=1 Tax=Seminavis robusta TaxID=568900 RepID=A0A9N8E6N4_9STRA|nr:expressed unknown protein [Seminavis robusta]|eukprot:Sro570_g168500.1 n/a (69) ;mRNA; f:19386-19983
MRDKTRALPVSTNKVLRTGRAFTAARPNSRKAWYQDSGKVSWFGIPSVVSRDPHVENIFDSLRNSCKM